jgi:hypothetical protein
MIYGIIFEDVCISYQKLRYIPDYIAVILLEIPLRLFTRKTLQLPVCLADFIQFFPANKAYLQTRFCVSPRKIKAVSGAFILIKPADIIILGATALGALAVLGVALVVILKLMNMKTKEES